jgi:multidrug efflux pump subunit AcrB
VLYGGYLDWALDHRRLVTAASASSWSSLARRALSQPRARLLPVGRRGQIRFHVRTNAGTRIETTEQLFERVEDEIHAVVPRTRS